MLRPKSWPYFGEAFRGLRGALAWLVLSSGKVLASSAASSGIAGSTFSPLASPRPRLAPARSEFRRANGINQMEDSGCLFSSPPRKRGSRATGAVRAALDARFRGHDGEVGGCRTLEAYH